MKFVPLLAAAASLLSTPALAKLEPSPAQALAGRLAGKTQMCVASSARDGRVRRFASGDLLYLGTGSTWYLNRPKACPTFQPGMSIVTDSLGSQLCSGDTIKLYDLTTHFFYGACQLGDFTPYARRR